jgi:hypothetical protein
MVLYDLVKSCLCGHAIVQREIQNTEESRLEWVHLESGPTDTTDCKRVTPEE